MLGGAYSTGLGLNLMGGSLEATLASAGPPRDGNVRFDGSWTGVWRTNPRVTQLRIGDGLSSGPRPRSAPGVRRLQRPVSPPRTLRRHPLRGRPGSRLADRGLSRRTAAGHRLGQRPRPLLARRAGRVRREPGGLHRLRALRRGAPVQPDVPGRERRDPGAALRVRPVARRLPQHVLPGERKSRSALRTLAPVDRARRDGPVLARHAPGALAPLCRSVRRDRQRMGARVGRRRGRGGARRGALRALGKPACSAPSSTILPSGRFNRSSRRRAAGRSGPRMPWPGRSATATISTSTRASTASPRRPGTTPAAGWDVAVLRPVPPRAGVPVHPFQQPHRHRQQRIVRLA